jgi:hypothetical protein
MRSTCSSLSCSSSSSSRCRLGWSGGPVSAAVGGVTRSLTTRVGSRMGNAGVQVQGPGVCPGGWCHVTACRRAVHAPGGGCMGAAGCSPLLSCHSWSCLHHTPAHGVQQHCACVAHVTVYGTCSVYGGVLMWPGGPLQAGDPGSAVAARLTTAAALAASSWCWTR